jgi:heme A synthase
MKLFQRYTWGTLGFNLLVILWGAYVRATGSGAGCGRHWPSCNGEIFPRNAQIETIVEFTHRLTSGVALLLVFGLWLLALRQFPRKHQGRTIAGLAFIFIVIEALLGAGLVLFQLVAENDSVARAVMIAIHQANTFFLLGALTLTAWFAGGGRPIRLNRYPGRTILIGLSFSGIFLLAMTGAVTALGDTLFPAGSLAEGIQQDLSPTAHFLFRLRIYHPLAALGMGLFLLVTALILVIQRPESAVKKQAAILMGIFFIQIMAGAVNLILLAPVTMQLIHLFLADLVLICFTYLATVSLAEAEAPELEGRVTGVPLAGSSTPQTNRV